jgi:hypothetical protein
MREIGSKPPSSYIAKFEKSNTQLEKALATHFIDLESYGIRDDNYDKFFKRRCSRLSKALEAELLLSKSKAGE